MRGLRAGAIAMVAVAATLIAAMAEAGIKVHVEHDPECDFTTLRTWVWHPTGAGQALKIITQEDDSAEFKKQIEPRLLPLVEQGFARKGFPMASGADPDFYVSYYVLVTVGSSDQHMGQFANLPQWGLPPVAPQTTAMKVYPRGSLILDVTSRETNEIVWRGVAQAELNWDDSQPKREKRVRDAIDELLKKFPPKPTKKR